MNISGNLNEMENAQAETFKVCFFLHFLFFFFICFFSSLRTKNDLLKNFGIFHVPEELFDFIAQHLSGTKLLQLSLVSKLTAVSCCMKKIVLNITRPLRDDDVELTQKSARKYLAMKIHLEEKEKEVAVIKTLPLTELKFRDMTFSTSLDFQRCFEPLAVKLKKLDISFIGKQSGEALTLIFAMLKDLNVNVTSLLVTCQKLPQTEKTQNSCSTRHLKLNRGVVERKQRFGIIVVVFVRKRQVF